MERAEFDRVADEYAALHGKNIKGSGESPEFFAKYKIADVFEETRRRGLTVSNVLDFGSGIGNSLPHFAGYFPGATVHCADVSARSLEISRGRFPNVPAKYVEIQGDRLPFENESFDLVFSACVFHHIPAAEHQRWLSELWRVTRKDGLLVVFEHNPMKPLTVSAVRTCPFDENAVLISAGEFGKRVRSAGWKDVRFAFRIFFPGALRFARPVERWLRWLPLGAQYFVIGHRT